MVINPQSNYRVGMVKRRKMARGLPAADAHMTVPLLVPIHAAALVVEEAPMHGFLHLRHYRVGKAKREILLLHAEARIMEVEEASMDYHAAARIMESEEAPMHRVGMEKKERGLPPADALLSVPLVVQRHRVGSQNRSSSS